MLVSTQARYATHTARSIYAKTSRRPEDDGELIRKVGERTEEERRKAAARRRAAAGLTARENGEGGSLATVSTFVPPMRRESTPEPIRPTSVVSNTLWSLIDAVEADGRPDAPVPVPAAVTRVEAPVSQAESLYLLLAQVIADD
jgi:hypothetical protein